MLLELYGNFLGEYLGVGDAYENVWENVANDAMYFAEPLTPSPLIDDISTWSPPYAPDREEQLVTRITTGPNYGCQITPIPDDSFTEIGSWWSLYATYGWNGLSVSNDYCEAYPGLCQSDRSTMQSRVIRHTSFGAGTIQFVSFGHVNAATVTRVQFGPIATQMRYNAINSALPDPYVSGGAFVSSTHQNNSDGSYTTSAGGVGFIDFTTGKPVSRDLVSSAVMTNLSTSETYDCEFRSKVIPFHSLSDQDRDGEISSDEMEELTLIYWDNGIQCSIDDPPHTAGDYRFDINFTNGTSMTETITVPAPISVDDLPPVTNVSAEWSVGSHELTVRWDRPIVYDNDSNDLYFLDVRVYSFRNGQTYSITRVKNLPVNLDGYTFDSDMTMIFDNGQTDQIKVSVMVKGYDISNSAARANRSYDFDYRTSGPLTESEIITKNFDISGDGRIGVEEAIYSLRAISGN